MTWAQILTQSRNELQEQTENFYTTLFLKQCGLDAQREMATRAFIAFGIRRQFSTVASQEEYLLSSYPGNDLFGIKRVIYGTNTPVANIKWDAIPLLSQTGTPNSYWIRENYMGFYPAPDAVSLMTIWGYRLPCREALTIYHDGGTSATAATTGIASNILTLTITGGANAGSNTYTLTAAAHDTLSELAVSINGLAKGFTATVADDVYASEPSNTLEAITAATCYTTNQLLYQNPVAPVYAQRHLANGILHRAMLRDNEFQKAAYYKGEWDRGIMEVERAAKRREGSFRNQSAVDVYSCISDDYFSLADGTIVVIK